MSTEPSTIVLRSEHAVKMARGSRRAPGYSRIARLHCRKAEPSLAFSEKPYDRARVVQHLGKAGLPDTDRVECAMLLLNRS